jgi:hypothetical protein
MKRIVLVVVIALVACANVALAADPACPACKRQVAADWRFCPWDGGALDEGAATKATALAPTSTATTPTRDSLEAARANPIDTIEDLFRAIAAGDEQWIRRLYRWETFFGAAADPATLEEKRADYSKRLIAKVRPTLAGRERFPSDIKLSPDVAELKIVLRDRATRAVAANYEFKLTRGDDGWKITSIRP